MDEPIVKDRVIDAIKKGEAKMRPRSYFILQTILVVTGIVLLFAAILYLASFIIFVLRQNGAWFGLDFGLHGWYLLFRSLPWTVLLLSFALVLILTLLLKRYAFVYQRPLLYFLFGILIFTALGSFFLAATSLQAVVQSYVASGTPAFVGSVYRYEEASPDQVHRGEIILLGNDGFVIENTQGETSTVFLAYGTTTELGESLTNGDFVVVFGDRNASGVIQAFGVERIAPINE